MSEYNSILQNEIIPKLLRKLKYVWTDQDFHQLLCEKKNVKFELLQDYK